MKKLIKKIGIIIAILCTCTITGNTTYAAENSQLQPVTYEEYLEYENSNIGKEYSTMHIDNTINNLNGESVSQNNIRTEEVGNEEYQTITGSVTSTSDIQTYNITIDFTKMNSAAICMVNTGKCNLSGSIMDSSGKIVNYLGVSDSQGSSWVFIDKPTSDAAICQYTITLTPKTVDPEYNSYRIMIGNKNDTEKMMSGKENAIMLNSYKPGSSQFFGITPNKYESWYRFTAVDNVTVFTICNNYPQIRFKILDINTQNDIYDSNYFSNVHKTQYVKPFTGAEKVRLTTTAGQEYYMVIYSPTVISSTAPILDKKLNIAVGKPNMIGSVSDDYYASSTVTGTTSSYSATATIDVSSNMPTTAVVWYADIVGYSNVFQLGQWRVKAPSQSAWKQTSGISMNSIGYDYVEGSSLNVKIPGKWYVSFKGAKANLTMRPGLKFTYYYELGD